MSSSTSTSQWSRRPRRGRGTTGGGRRGRINIQSMPAPDYDDDDGIPLFAQIDEVDDEDNVDEILAIGGGRRGGGRGGDDLKFGGKVGGSGGGGDDDMMTPKKMAAADPTRAPKLAAFLLLIFFSVSGAMNYIQGSSSTDVNRVTVRNRSTTGGRIEKSGKKRNRKGKEKNENEREDDEQKGKQGARRGEGEDGSGGGSDDDGDDDAAEDQSSLTGKNSPSSSSSSSSSLVSTTNMKFKLPRVDITSPEMTYYADITEPFLAGDIPVFWHVPRSGGSTIKDITANCLNLVQASEVGVFAGHGSDPELRVVQDVEGARFVNVDTTNTFGIDRAERLGLSTSGLADLVVTPYMYHAGRLFDGEHRGRIFTLIRHPVERAVSMYYYLRSTKDGQHLLNGMSLEQYAQSDIVENNWMTRFLSNQLGGELTPENEALAREILRRKVLVGLLSEKGKSMERFEAYFGWKVDGGEKMENCREKLLDWSWSNKNKHPFVREGGTVWNLLEEANSFDIRLYGYAQELFKMQGVFFKSEDEEDEDEDEEDENDNEEGNDENFRKEMEK